MKNAPGLSVALALVVAGGVGVWGVSSALERQTVTSNARFDALGAKFDLLSAQLNEMGYDFSGRVSALEVRIEQAEEPEQ